MPKIEDDCGENAFELVSGVLNRMIGSIFLVTCRNYDPMGDKCSELLPPTGAEPHGKYFKVERVQNLSTLFNMLL